MTIKNLNTMAHLSWDRYAADFFRVAEDGCLREHWDALTFDGADLFDTINLD